LLAAVLALAAVAPTLARVQHKHVVVVRGKGFTLRAWDDPGRDKKLCVLLKSGKPSSSVCAQKLNAQTGLLFASFQNKGQTFTAVGGAAMKKVTKVVATFGDGKQLTMKTRRGPRYKGRRHGKVRFWAGRHAGSAPLRTLVGKTASGATLQVTPVAPPPEPPPPSPCGCHGPPVQRIVCPLQPCPE
jgi:hypothetical protein